MFYLIIIKFHQLFKLKKLKRLFRPDKHKREARREGISPAVAILMLEGLGVEAGLNKKAEGPRSGPTSIRQELEGTRSSLS